MVATPNLAQYQLAVVAVEPDGTDTLQPTVVLEEVQRQPIHPVWEQLIKALTADRQTITMAVVEEVPVLLVKTELQVPVKEVMASIMEIFLVMNLVIMVGLLVVAEEVFANQQEEMCATMVAKAEAAKGITQVLKKQEVEQQEQVVVAAVPDMLVVPQTELEEMAVQA